MNEYTIGYLAVGNIVGLAVTALFYMLGGRNNKGLRRFGASGIITITVCLTALALGKFSWFLLLIYPLKVIEYVQGYSNDHGIPGWVKRLFIALTSILTGSVVCFILGNGWWLLPIHALVSLGTVMFAFKNPIAAAAEEPLVCTLNNLVTVFYAFV